MKVYIKIIEDLLNTKIKFTLAPEDYGYIAIEQLIKGYRELEYKYDKALSDLIEAHKKSISTSEIEAKIAEIDKEIEWQKEYGNTRTRDELETKKEHFLEILEDK